jgi:hypothetical protein
VAAPVLVNSWAPEQPFVYLRVTGIEGLAERIRAEPREVYCFVNRGEAGDHTPGGEPTAEIASRLFNLLV